MNAVTTVEADAVQVQQPRALTAAPDSPADMLMMLMSKGATLEQIEKVMDLQDRHQRREAEKAYNLAFAEFKAEAVRVLKNKHVTDGPLKGKTYAELHSVVDAVTPALSKHGLSASWKLTRDEKDWIEVTCTLKHSGGHSESVSMGGPPDAGGAKNAIQARASSITYLQRYTLKAICGISEGGDDVDGNGRGEPQDSPQLDAGRAAAMEGMQALTKWWGSLTPKDRGKLQAEFRALKQAAETADRENGNA